MIRKRLSSLVLSRI